MEDMKLIIFKLNNEWYGIDIDLVSAIEKMQPVVRIPNSVPYVQGIMNLRGSIIPVCSLRNRFNLPEAEVTDNTKFLVTTVGNTQLALTVDMVDGIYDIQGKQCFETPRIVQTDATKFLRGVALLEQRLIVILDVDELLTEKDKAALEKMVDDQQ